MWMRVFLFGLCLGLIVAGQVATVDLSKSSAEFPTNQVSARGCNAAYDSPDPRTPASCFPFPIRVAIKGVERKAEGGPVVDVAITNLGSSAIRLPRAPEPPAGGKGETFIALDLYSPPGSLPSNSESLAFADASTESSVVEVGPGESVIYRVPFRGSLERRKEVANHQLQAELRAYSVKKGATASEDISVRRGNPIFSDTYTIPN